MKRFVKYFFCHYGTDLAQKINEYADENALLIVSIAIKDTNGALVLFEEN